MRLVIVQYAGDYREAVQRIQSTGQETYYAQRYSVESVAALTARCESVTVITCLTATRYDELLPNGVRAVGAGFSTPFDEQALIALVAEHNPDRLIVRTPARQLLRWAVSRQCRTIGFFADSFSTSGLKDRVKSFLLSRLLNEKPLEWIFNHGLNSCLSLRKIGVDADKVIPWDWPAMVTPADQPKTLPQRSTHTALFVGILTESKGIGDTLRAIARLKSANVSVALRVVGAGEGDALKALAESLGIGDRVEFLGLLPHARVLDEMRDADLVVVPSRHDYAEGFPMTIYETLCSRTPLVASDHPMFQTNLTHNVDSWIFPAGDAEALASGIQRLLSDGELYARLSAASAETWTRLQLPVKWAEAVERWVSDSEEDRKWLFEHRLSSGIYDLARYER